VGWIALLVALSEAVLSGRSSRWIETMDRAVCAAVSKVADGLEAVFRQAAAE